MADFHAYGFGAFEVESFHHVSQRVVFAISAADRPKFLSWYLFKEALPLKRWVEETNMLEKPDYAARIAKMLVVGIYAFSYPKINVSQFTDNKNGSHSTSAFYSQADREGALACKIFMPNLPLGPLTIEFTLFYDTPTKNFLAQNRRGFLTKLGTIDISKTSIFNALRQGPPFASAILHPINDDLAGFGMF